MTSLKNDRFLKALRLEPVDQTPIWVMRQAGRYLPEYLELRSQVPNFMAFCRDVERASEATVQPLARFPLDAAIVFSDILTVPDALGCPVSFKPNLGPVLDKPVRDAQSLAQLVEPDCEQSLGFVGDVIRRTQQKLDGLVPLIGFSGSPWTVATYMVEGSSSKLFLTIKKMLYTDPTLLHQLLQKITHLTIDYLTMQAKAGAQALMVFDSWGGALSPAAYHEFSLTYLRQITDKLKSQPETKDIPLILFSKGAHSAYQALAATGCQGIGVDWGINIGDVKRLLGDTPVALQGNLDPAIMLSTPDRIREEVKFILNSYGQQPGHIFNLGHGIDKTTPIENMAALVDAVHTFSQNL